MLYLGIDYGQKWCGIAKSEGEIATPVEIIKTEKISSYLKSYPDSVVVVGLSEGKMAEEIKLFVKKLKQETGITFEFQDETLTSYQAKSINKVGKKDHHLAAAFILQRWLDEHA